MVGPKGATVQALRQSTGVRIDVDNQEDPNNPGTQLIRFRCLPGQEAAMQQAIEQVQHQISFQHQMNIQHGIIAPDQVTV